MTLISKHINQAVELLSKGELVAIPTETVYGLAGHAFKENAVRRIFQLKQRPLFNPLIVHIHSSSEIEKYVKNVPIKAEALARRFWPGSLTLVLEKQAHIPELVTAGKPTVAIRVPNHPLTLELLERLNFPLVAPSANPFGLISPTHPEHVVRYFGETLAMVLDGGECLRGIESTIIGFENEEPILYRLGSVTVEEIVDCVGEVKVKNVKESAPDAPGMLKRHYSPKTTTYLVDDLNSFLSSVEAKRIGVIVFTQCLEKSDRLVVENLSKRGDLQQAASNLYSALHRLDLLNLEMIVAERFPDHGLGKTINDRLQRATHKT